MICRVLAASAALYLSACTHDIYFDRLDAGLSVSDAAAVDAPITPSFCTGDDGCGLSLQCELGSGRCVECVDNTHCNQVGLGVCDVARHQCVECESSTSCGTGYECVRDAHRCVKSCSSLEECPAGSVECDPERHLCEQCEVRADCLASDGTHICIGEAGVCVECISDTECSAPVGHCDRATNHCVECVDSDHCTSDAPWCDPVSHVCSTG